MSDPDYNNDERLQRAISYAEETLSDEGILTTNLSYEAQKSLDSEEE